MKRAIVVLLLLLAVPLIAAPQAPARGPFELGLQDDPVFVTHPAGTRTERPRLSRTVAYRAARSLRASTLRINVVWAWVVPRPTSRTVPRTVSYDWRHYDAAVDDALARGLRPQLTLTGPAPAWATSDRRYGTRRPNPRRFAEFAAAAATHFAGRVERYSIWNEPNWYSLLKPARSGPLLYRELYRRAQSEIYRVDPFAKVLLGEFAPMERRGLSTAPLRFLRAMLCRDSKYRRTRQCEPLVADGVAHHPYTLRYPPRHPGPSRDDVTTGSLRRLVKALARLRRVGALETPFGETPPIYLTEYGWQANSRLYGPAVAARYMREGLELAWKVPQVRQVVLYEVGGTPPGSDQPWDTALLTYRGSPRPIFRSAVGWARSRLRVPPAS